QALLEIALVAPIILLLLMGLIQFALIFERQIGIENAVREAARRTAALAAPDDATAQTNADWALLQLKTLLGNSQDHEASRDTISVCIFTPASPDNVDPSGNSQVMVKITESYRHPLWLPIVDLILDPIDGKTDQSLNVTTSSEFHVEQSGSNSVGSSVYARTDPSDTSACS
ncbi:MAG: TadE/TadG family type IV pilus assembly protein, partial [Minisyncoccia bacterium]